MSSGPFHQLGCVKPLSTVLILPWAGSCGLGQKVPGDSSPGPVHPNMSPAERTAFKLPPN